MSINDIIGTLTTGGGAILIVLLTLIQISPLKLDPWTFIAKTFGNAINKDIKDEITEIKSDMNAMKTDLQNIKNTDDERYAIQCRIRILRFNDELLVSETGHSKDYFDQILMDIDEYEAYCDEHPKFKNNMTMFAVDNIKRCYNDCLSKHTFLRK